MKLLIISNTPHVKVGADTFGWGPTVNEINFLRTKFSTVTHIAPVEVAQQEPPLTYTPVVGVEVIALANQGHSLRNAWLILKHIRQADLIHVRCPENISLVALLVLGFFPRKQKWIKYEGEWDRKNDSLKNRIQRSLIRSRLSNHFVTIDSVPSNEPSFINHFENPVFYKQELEVARREAANKTLLPNRWVGIFVGGLPRYKGGAIVVEAFSQLVGQFSGRLHLIGDIEDRDDLRRQVRGAGLDNLVTEGWLTKDQLNSFYSQAHFIFLPSQQEGWHNAITEGMSYGAVPLVPKVSELQLLLKQFRAGLTIDSHVQFLYREAIMDYLEHPEQWKTASANASDVAEQFSMEDWWSKLDVLINKYNPSLNA